MSECKIRLHWLNWFKNITVCITCKVTCVVHHICKMHRPTRLKHETVDLSRALSQHRASHLAVTSRAFLQTTFNWFSLGCKVTVLNITMKFRIHKRRGNFLTSWMSVGFIAQLHVTYEYYEQIPGFCPSSKLVTVQSRFFEFWLFEVPFRPILCVVVKYNSLGWLFFYILNER
jgi:hypothetical protein